jgi:hypothetical protein
MTIAQSLITCLVILSTQGGDPSSGGPMDQPASASVRVVLDQGGYPWYDRQTDGVKPMLTDRSSWLESWGERMRSFFKWLDGFFGRLGSKLPSLGGANPGSIVPTLLFAVAGGLLVVILWRLWRLHEPSELARDRSVEGLGQAARIAGLASDVALEATDTWNEALRRRAAGDRGGAVIWLFLDQLLSLQRRGLIRLMPGRTARHYVTVLEDSMLRDSVGATLGLFEDFYYGHRVPTATALESVWALAEAFRRRLAAIEAGQ